MINEGKARSGERIEKGTDEKKNEWNRRKIENENREKIKWK